MGAFFGNWRTTAIGAVMGALQVIMPLVKDGSALHTQDWINAGMALLLGLFASDAKGGSSDEC